MEQNLPRLLLAGILLFAFCGNASSQSTVENTNYGTGSLSHITTGNNNSAFGYNALLLTDTGNNNTGVGASSLANNKGSDNTALGSYALFSNTTGSGNIGLGFQALTNNKTGNGNIAIGFNAMVYNQVGYDNIAIGGDAISNNDSGSFNVGLGYAALLGNTKGSNNCGIGYTALYSNTSGSSNTATGTSALYANTSGTQNTATGGYALTANKTGSNNAGSGFECLFNNVSGSNNTAAGADALYLNTSGGNNTAAGVNSLATITTGSDNTALGYGADVASGALTNCTSLGYGASATKSNEIVLGNSAITKIGGAVKFTVISDGRFKTNVKENVPGLKFISQLTPVTYTLKARELDKFRGASDAVITGISKEYDAAEKRIRTGFIAQDVEKAAKSIGYDFEGVQAPENVKDNYSLSYADFVPPLVKSVQELSANNDALQQQVNALQADKAVLQTQLQQMASRMEQFESSLSQCCSNFQPASGQNNLSLPNSSNSGTADVASLQQNVPNPFNSTTYIQYYLPSTASAGTLVISDMNGQTLKQFSISSTGFGKQTIAPGQFAQGTYTYTLYVDGKRIDTKQMVLTR